MTCLLAELFLDLSLLGSEELENFGMEQCEW
jgi:hypothetical protein